LLASPCTFTDEGYPSKTCVEVVVYARDILPMHLKHHQKDSGMVIFLNCMRSQLYLNAIEMVPLGDRNVRPTRLKWR
jgi:hypothetical protein